MADDTNEIIDSGVALYHPHIHVRNVDWLKSTLLYWDRVRRIVPDNFPPDEEDEERMDVLEAIKANLLPRTYTNNYVEAARDRFFEYIWELNKVDRSGKDVSIKQRVTNLLSTAYERVTGRKDASSEELKNLLEGLKNEKEDRQWVDLWNGKMTNELKQLFLEAGLAKTGQHEYFFVQKAAADIYMMCLANVMKDKIGSSLITDYEGYAEVGEHIDYTGPDQSEGYRKSVLLRLEIEWPTNETLNGIAMSDFIEFHENSRNERQRFRQALETLVRKAKKIETDEYRSEDFFKHEAQNFKDALEDHKSKMQTIGIKGAGTLLRVSTPGILTSVPAAFALNPVTAPILGVGIIISLLAWWSEVKEQRKKEIDSFNWHYLLSLRDISDL